METLKKILCVLIGGPFLIAGFAGLIGDPQKVGGSKLVFLILMVLGAFLIYLGFFKKSKNASVQAADCNIQLDLNMDFQWQKTCHVSFPILLVGFLLQHLG